MMIHVIGPGAKRPVETHRRASRYCANTKKDAPPWVATAPMSQTP